MFRSTTALLAMALVFMIAFVSGCDALHHGVKATTPQQEVYLSGADVGAALIAADTYQALNDCNAPGHTMPCSTKANNDRIQAAKVQLLNARNKARDLVRTPGFDQSSLATIQQEILAAIAIINAVVGQSSAWVPQWLNPDAGASFVTAAAVLGLGGTAAQSYLSALLFLLSLAEKIFGAGSRISTFTKTVADQVRQMQAENNRNPTDSEWAAQDAELDVLLAQPPQAPPGGVG